jgi:hypothetical protein
MKTKNKKRINIQKYQNEDKHNLDIRNDLKSAETVKMPMNNSRNNFLKKNVSNNSASGRNA